MVFTGDEEPRGQAWESCALADSVRPQTIVAAQWDVRVDLENGSWPGSHVFASKKHVSFKKKPTPDVLRTYRESH